MDSAIRRLADRVSGEKTVQFDLDEKKGLLRCYRSPRTKTNPLDITEEPGGTFEIQDSLRGVIHCRVTEGYAIAYLLDQMGG